MFRQTDTLKKMASRWISSFEKDLIKKLLQSADECFKSNSINLLERRFTINVSNYKKLKSQATKKRRKKPKFDQNLVKTEEKIPLPPSVEEFDLEEHSEEDLNLYADLTAKSRQMITVSRKGRSKIPRDKTKPLVKEEHKLNPRWHSGPGKRNRNKNLKKVESIVKVEENLSIPEQKVEQENLSIPEQKEQKVEQENLFIPEQKVEQENLFIPSLEEFNGQQNNSAGIFDIQEGDQELPPLDYSLFDFNFG
jgi:hypothetical protein